MRASVTPQSRNLGQVPGLEIHTQVVLAFEVGSHVEAHPQSAYREKLGLDGRTSRLGVTSGFLFRTDFFPIVGYLLMNFQYPSCFAELKRGPPVSVQYKPWLVPGIADGVNHVCAVCQNTGTNYRRGSLLRETEKGSCQSVEYQPALWARPGDTSM
jgi:hypothetical protein